MTYSLRFLPEVEEDVIGGYAWYEARSPGLGEEFLRMFYACTGGIRRTPLAHPKVHNGFRRCLLRRFPWAVYFVAHAGKVVVFGLFHCARDPRTIETRLQHREESERP